MNKEIKPLEELLDSLRDNEGFPVGKDEDILTLSDPPYYTACPNPYINNFIEENGKPYDEETDDYYREPFIGDVSEGKTDPIYMAHAYHTKVPHKAIMKYIKHYTHEGDIVLDGFCGTGMTAVGAQFLNRHAIISDISPIATFIAKNLTSKITSEEFKGLAEQMLQKTEIEHGWMYKTLHNIKSDKQNGKFISQEGIINYIIWSDVIICPYCNEENVFWDIAIDEDNRFLEEMNCVHCKATIQKERCKRSFVHRFDEMIQQEIRQTKQVPVLINYIFENKKIFKKPDDEDLNKIKKIEETEISSWFPVDQLIRGVKTSEPIRLGFTHSHHFYTKRNLIIVSALLDYAKKSTKPFELTFSLTSFLVKTGSRLHNIGLKKGKINLAGAVPNALYMPSLIAERNIFILARNKINDLQKAFLENSNKKESSTIIQTGSSTSLNIPNNTIDYVFVDPPFGSNLMYSELNFLWESWIQVFTNNLKEAIINNVQRKYLNDYKELMAKSFAEFYRVLKPNRWITIEFHNTKSNIWTAIQDSLIKAGFIISQVAILDKQQGTFNQMTNPGSVSKDLVISAYKPKASFERQFLSQTGEGLEEEFVRMHLDHLTPEPTIERTNQMLYSKLLAYYVQRGYAVKYNAQTFFKMLMGNFVEEDGYWFNQDQLVAYHEFKQKMKLQGLEDFGLPHLFVSDEQSATIWLHSFLDQPKSYQDIHPAFTKISTISDDKVPELMELLEENFVKEGDKFRRPMSAEEKQSKEGKRQGSLLQEFDLLLLDAKNSKKKIKICRKQSIIAGFENCYRNNRFKDILTLAAKLDKKILENNSEITEFIDIAETKVKGF